MGVPRLDSLMGITLEFRFGLYDSTFSEADRGRMANNTAVAVGLS